LFGMGISEILLILVIALIIFGPGKIVDISKSLGKMVHTLKKATSDIKTQITTEVEKENTSVTPQKVSPLSEQEPK
jgi:Tat protein translocase TatB subunit